MHLLVKRLSGFLPTRSRDGVGFDLYAPEDGFVDPLSRKLVKVGIATEFTEGHAGMICDRSGMANKGITVLGGVIDPSYRGEWGVILYNTTPTLYEFKRGDRIAQVLFVPVQLPEAEEVEGELSVTARGSGGFGSTGN